MHTHTHAHTYTLYVIRINNLHKKKPLNNLLFLYMFFFFSFLVYNVCLLLMRYLALLCLAFVLIWSKVIVLGPMAGCALGSAEAVFLFLGYCCCFTLSSLLPRLFPLIFVFVVVLLVGVGVGAGVASDAPVNRIKARKCKSFISFRFIWSTWNFTILLSTLLLLFYLTLVIISSSSLSEYFT